MADKRISKKKKKGAIDENIKPTSEEESIAKHLRFNLETKKATMYGDEAFYFFGSKAVDFLLDSKWAKGDSKLSVQFTHRESVVAFLTKLLNYGKFFTRAHLNKIEKKVKDIKKKDEKIKVEKEDKKKEDESEKSESPRLRKEKKDVKKVKKKVKYTLEPHDFQCFIDSDKEAYVWIYDPVSCWKLILGTILVLFVIAVCLFPLWPESVREYSWYLSVAGAIFVGGILVLALLRYIVFALIFMFTMGNVRFWFLPNLTAECGFFESFVPLYTYAESKVDNKSKKKFKKDKIKNEENLKKEKLEDLKSFSSIEKKNEEDKVYSNESEESSESIKDEDWVKVKKSTKQDTFEAKC
ncbi:translocation protein SEC62 isoform X1 [Hydra vulgaris]|nr:translocation protein SEC62 [Hydra vulgaris]